MTQDPQDTPYEGAPTDSPAGESVAPDAEAASGVDNWLEEGGRLEPSDVTEVEGEQSGPEGSEVPEVPESPGDRLVVAERERDELRGDLQRLQAEFLNYKRRVERDRDLVVQNAKFSALAPIVEVLDNIDRAREHGEVEGGFRSVAEQLERVVAAAGLVKFGEVGDAFDPTVHEALSHLGQDPEVTVTTCTVIAKAGYKIGDRVVRAAQVLVVDPADD